MVLRFLWISGIFLTFVLNTLLADEQESILNEDLGLLLEKTGRILKEKDYERFRIMYPQLQNALKYWNDYELTKGGNQDSLIENSRPNEDQVSISSNDVSDSMFQFLPTWLSRNEQQKRAYHRALCHFKLCNMGSKRSRFWNMVWRRNI